MPTLIDPVLDVQTQAARIALAKLDGLSAEDARAVRAWSQADPGHALELALAEDLLHGPELAEALRTVTGAELGLFQRARVWSQQCVEQLFAKPALMGSGVAAATLVVAFALPVLLSDPQSVAGSEQAQTLRYVAERGAPRSITLADGGVIHLNADSMIDVRYMADAREVDLLRGEALFEVVNDADRPFTVDAGETEFTVLGTQFNVDQRSGAVELSVYEGRVAGPESAFSAGEGARYQAGVVEAFSFDPTEGADWRRGWLEARGLSLGEAAEELQRYADRRIRIAPDVADRLITGRFPLNDPETAIRRLAETQGLVVEENVGSLYVIDQ